MQTLLKLTIVAGLLCAAGCEKKQQTVQIDPVEPETKEYLDWQESLYAMSDNAAQYDLSMHDIHFVPYTTELNGLGTKRLDQLCRVLESYGGTIRYQTSSTDAAMLEIRVQHIHDYMAATGRDISKIQVALGPSAGRGIKANEALVAKAGMMEDEEGTSSTSVSGSSSSPGAMLSSAGE